MSEQIKTIRKCVLEFDTCIIHKSHIDRSKNKYCPVYKRKEVSQYDDSTSHNKCKEVSQ